jgi:hypothetical protein
MGAVRADHAGGDGRRTAREYAGAVGVLPATGWLTVRQAQTHDDADALALIGPVPVGGYLCGIPGCRPPQY